MFINLESESPIFNYSIPAFNHLQRAKKQLQLFDAGTVQSLFYCALDLRFGIEARLFEYIEASSSTLRNPLKLSKEYVATKLLKILLETNPEYDNPATLVIGLPGRKSVNRFDYTPVTKKLASYHGMLGEVLHFKFFKNNEKWFIKQRLSNRGSQKSLLDYRDFLAEVMSELEYATSGHLLTHPIFTKLIEEADEATLKDDRQLIRSAYRHYRHSTLIYLLIPRPTE